MKNQKENSYDENAIQVLDDISHLRLRSRNVCWRNK